MIKLITLHELFVCLVKLMENILHALFETWLKSYYNYPVCRLICGYLGKQCMVQNRKMSLKIKGELFEEKQNFLFFAWRQAKL